MKVGQKSTKNPIESTAGKADGGPGGRIQSVDFIEFFVGQNLKSSRIVPHDPVTPNSRL